MDGVVGMYANTTSSLAARGIFLAWTYNIDCDVYVSLFSTEEL